MRAGRHAGVASALLRRAAQATAAARWQHCAALRAGAQARAATRFQRALARGDMKEHQRQQQLAEAQLLRAAAPAAKRCAALCAPCCLRFLARLRYLRC